MSRTLKPDPFWWEDAPRPDLGSAGIPDRADVVVVGAGFTGLSAALTLARAGRDVLVLEKHRPGEGASSRNGGIASGNLRLGFAGAIRAFGLEHAKRIHAEAREARRDLARFIADEGIDCDWKPVGRFTGAMRPGHYERLARECDLLNTHLDSGAWMVGRSEQHAEIGSDLYHGGMVLPDIGGLHPGKFHQGLLDRALGAGARVCARSPVEAVEDSGEPKRIRTARGTVAAREVIVATNGYTGPATPWLQRRIVPIPSQIVATERLPDGMLDRLMPKRRMLGETRNLYHYFRPSSDDSRIIFGGRAGALTEDPGRKAKRLGAGLAEIFPELKGVGLTHSWFGYTGFTFDFMPKLVVRNGIHYAAGFCGSGVVWARWLGNLAAQGIVGNRPVETVFRADDFATRPFYRGRPWFLPLTVAWYAAKDRIGL